MIEFNKESEYDAHIATVVNELSALCYKYGIPMFFTAAISNTEDGKTEFRNEYVSATKTGVDLLDDQLSKHVNVKNGFNTVIPIKLEEIEIAE